MAGGLAALLLCGCRTTSTSLRIREKVRRGKRTVIIENGLYRAVLVPEIARFPLSYFFKTTGHEHFAQPASLSKPNEGFQYYGGIVDSLPWVSGKVGERRLPNKGYLYSSPWRYETGRDYESAWFEGETSVEYQDPVKGHTCRLSYRKRMTAYEGSSQLRMDQTIKNTGQTAARFTFSLHGRTAIAQWDKGDFFYAPGNRCYVYYMANEQLARRGVEPPCWAPWPLDEATEFRPQKQPQHVFAFVPARWCVAGDEKHKETLFFVASPIDCAGREEVMKMGVFMTNAAYLVEPCVTYSISGNPDEWANPGQNLSLKPGQECRFTLSLAAYQGVSRDDLPGVVAVYPECIVLTKPDAAAKSGLVALEGKIASAARARLEIRSGGQTLQTYEIEPGIVDLSDVASFPAQGCSAFSLVLCIASTERTLLTTGPNLTATHGSRPTCERRPEAR